MSSREGSRSGSGPILTVDGVGKTYVTGDEDLTVLTNVSLRLDAGEILAITGESGSGKSTLLNLIAGLDSPTHGTIVSAGYEINRLSEEELTQYRAWSIGLIFQFHYLLKDFTALENVMMPAYMAGTPRAAALERAADLLRQVDLSERSSHYPLQLSGGERQRVAVARSLVNDPELILADEPTGNLDERNSRNVEELLLELVRTHRKSLLLVTHDRSFAARAGNQLHLDKGELVPGSGRLPE